jgi:hypothetical protein
MRARRRAGGVDLQRRHEGLADLAETRREAHLPAQHDLLLAVRQSELQRGFSGLRRL